ncbi:MAG: Eco57I restriction-modification methylase domain-containing protein, partial [Chloroflexota bacterium]
MWLATISRDRPLSFLDHHVRLGNTLVGARLDQLTPATDSDTDTNGQLPLWDVSAFSDTVRDAVGRMMTIEGTIAEVVTDVKAQEKSFAVIFDDLEPWRKLAHVWTAQHFGLDVSADQWSALYTAITTDTTLSSDLQTLLDEALRLHDEYHFFHWELAFPEVFFDENGDPIPEGGFDAVVGNPPYVRMEKIKPIKPFLSEHYQVHESRADLFLYFYERAIDLLRLGNRFGYITSGTFMSSNSGTPFRQFVHKTIGLEWIANFGENQPFKGAEMVFPTIFIARAGLPEETFKHYFMEGNVLSRDMESVFLAAQWENTYSHITGMDEWRFQSKELTELFKKIDGTAMRLGTLINEETFYGVKTGLNEAFILSEDQRNQLVQTDPASEEIIRPMLSGRDLRPWYKIDGKLYLIFAMRGVDIEKYPAVLEHLRQFKTALARRATIDSHEWYELQQPQMGIYAKFSQPKICWAEIAKLPRFSIDQDGYYPNNSCYFAVSDEYSLDTLLALMQSRITWF